VEANVPLEAVLVAVMDTLADTRDWKNVSLVAEFTLANCKPILLFI
jgi:hypothetical protein